MNHQTVKQTIFGVEFKCEPFTMDSGEINGAVVTQGPSMHTQTCANPLGPQQPSEACGAESALMQILWSCGADTCNQIFMNSRQFFCTPISIRLDSIEDRNVERTNVGFH